MNRRLFTILSALSLAVLLATIFLWVTGTAHEAFIRAGGAGFSGTSKWGIGMNVIVRLGYQNGLYVAWSRSDYFQGIGVPYWLLTVSATVLPGFWWWRWKGKRRRKPGFCRRCGYDLRASKERCPECGAPIAVQTAG